MIEKDTQRLQSLQRRYKKVISAIDYAKPFISQSNTLADANMLAREIHRLEAKITMEKVI